MSKNNNFDYIYGSNLDEVLGQSSSDYYVAPKLFFDGDKFEDLGAKEKMLYVIIEDMFGNKEVGNKETIETIVKDISNIIKCSDEKIVESLYELRSFGLVDFEEITDGKVNLYVKCIGEVVQELEQAKGL